MKIKAMLVDDEIHILNNLSKVLPWNDMDIEIVSLARNGVEALAAAKKHRPDLILTDIRMPVMDGMALLKEIRQLGMESEVLLLTGYQQFEYAQAAIHYGVQEYICKPINYEELEQSVKEVAKNIREKQLLQSKEQKFDRIAYLANENYLLQSLLGQSYKEEHPLWSEDEEWVDELSYFMYLVDVNEYAYASVQWTVANRKDWNKKIRKKLKMMLDERQAKEAAVLQIREGEWCIIIPNTTNESVMESKQLNRMLFQLQDEERANEHVHFRMCVKQIPCSVAELAVVYKQMQQQLTYHNSDEAIVIADQAAIDLARTVHADVDVKWQWIEELSKGLRNGSAELLGQVINSMKERLPQLCLLSVARTEKLLHYLLIYLLREMREQQMLGQEQEEQIWNQLQESMNVKELQALVLSLISQARSSLSTKKSSEVLMFSAENYIQQQLDKDFGIDDIAQHLGISCSYFCFLFKQHFGETFVEYLTRQRMEIAKSLLMNSDKTITQIGTQVGYIERRYFTKVFQKYTGMTPSEYRIKHAEADIKL